MQEQGPEQPASQAGLCHPGTRKGLEGSGTWPLGQPDTAKGWLQGRTQVSFLPETAWPDWAGDQ